MFLSSRTVALAQFACQMSFNPDEFMAASVTGATDTKVVPCPVGEFQAVISKVQPRQWQSKDGTKSGIALDVLWSVEDSSVKSFLGREEVIVKQGIMLDLTDTGGVDNSAGKNIALGRLREATNTNDASTVFSFNQLPGRMGKISVTHRINGEDTFAEVKGVAKLA